MLKVAWFSAGVSSAVAIKRAIIKTGVDKIFYIHIEDQHPDTLRFINECEKWFGQKVEQMQSLYKSVNNALLGAGGKGYVNGPAGAACTRLLKKRVRKEWELDQKGKLQYIWGMDIDEKDRAERLQKNMPEQEHIFPLIDLEISKEQAHQILKASGIKRPAMYDLGYKNNNCIGCVKGGKGYWNKIRKDFPDVFASRSQIERRIGGTCIKGVFLDELSIDAGRDQEPVCEDCGIFCEVMRVI